MGLYEDAVALANHHFVGRQEEIHRFRAVLSATEGRIWWVFGPGGIGKSRLLAVLAEEADRAGCRVVTEDLRTVDGSRRQLQAVGAAVARTEPATRTVALLDAVETTTPIGSRSSLGVEDWLHDDLLPCLPSGSVVVLASRQAPSAGWRSDPVWSAILDTIPLRGLPVDDGRRLLELGGVPPDAAPRLAELVHGHPLALQLLADAVAGSGGRVVPEALDDAPDLVAAVLKHLIAGVPDEAQQAAIQTASLARVTTRGLVRDAVGPENADAVFDWLADRPWIDWIPGGICPHDLARDVIQADLRNNDPDRHRAALLTVRNHVLDPERVRRDPVRAAQDWLYLQRHSSVLRNAWDWASFGRTDATPYRPGDRDVLAELVTDCYGPASVGPLDHWLVRQPQAFTVLRSADGVIGFTAAIGIDDPTEEDLAADPSLAAVWHRARIRGRPRRGEVMGLFRFVCDRVAGTMPPSPTYNAVTIQAGVFWLTTPGLSLDYIVKPRDGSYKPMMDYIDFHETPDADHMVGDREMVVFEHDWRENPLARWLERFEALEGGDQPDIPVDTAPVLVALEESAFADAVRAALRDFTRPDRLTSNPLLASRVVLEADGEGVEALIGAIRAAFAALEDHPRTERARRAVDRTYLRGAVTQEAAAEVLDMAFSTYRRHLSTGIGLLVECLWQWELYGRTD